MPRSAMFMLQFSAFAAGFFLCGGVIALLRHPSNLNWISQFILMAVFLAWSFRYSAKLRRKFPKIGEVKYSD